VGSICLLHGGGGIISSYSPTPGARPTRSRSTFPDKHSIKKLKKMIDGADSITMSARYVHPNENTFLDAKASESDG
jgi:hypothetical protein